MRLSTSAVAALLMAASARAADDDDAPACYSGASVAGAAVGTLLAALLLAAAALLLWRLYWRGRRGKHLVLVTDAEAPADQYAFDNPCFKDGTPMAHHAAEKEVAKEDQKARWSAAWSPLGALVAGKPADKRRALDDSFIGEPHIRIVSLRSHDFTGLGFTVCGNMRDGIFVKDVLHRGPASESGRIAPGDRIDSVRISFRHMVFEDALTILSYASPYDVQLEVENATTSRPSTLIRTKRMSGSSVGPADRICHPFYRSQSISDLAQIGKDSLKRVHQMGGATRSPKISKSDSFNDSGVGDYPTLKMTNSPKASQAKKDITKQDKGLRVSPPPGVVVKPERIKKAVGKITVTSNKASIDEPDSMLENMNKYQKFGVRVLPDSADALKNINVQGNFETSGEHQSVKQVSVPDIVYTSTVEPERHQNEKNIMLENVVTKHSTSEEGNGAGTSKAINKQMNADNGKLKSYENDDAVKVANSLFYDERGIDVGPVAENSNVNMTSFKPDIRKDSDKSSSKLTDTENLVEGTKEHNVKLFLSKGLQNLKEKLHPDKRKNNASDVHLQSNHEKIEDANISNLSCLSSGSEDIDDDDELIIKHEFKKMENKIGKEFETDEEIDIIGKQSSGDENSGVPYNSEIPTDIPEEVQRAAMAARSNRKSSTPINIISSDINKINDSRLTESRKSLSEDSSSDYEATPGISTDSLGRPPKRHNKRKAPLPPAEDSVHFEGSNNKIKEVASSLTTIKSSGNESNRVPAENTVKLFPENNVRGNGDIKVPEISSDLYAPSNSTKPFGGGDVTNITVNTSSNEIAQPFGSKVGMHGVTDNVSPHNSVFRVDSSSTVTSTMDIKNVDSDSVNISNANSDSDLERNEENDEHEGKKSKKGGTTIELNSSHITIHHSPSNTAQVSPEIESENTRKAASLGDLSRLDTEQPMSILERAVSLDLADGGTPIGTKKRKAPLPPGEDYLSNCQDGEENVSYKKEPRLDGAMDTFQRQRLKKSSDWGTLEEALKQTESFLNKSSQLSQGKGFSEVPKITPDESHDKGKEQRALDAFSFGESQNFQDEKSLFNRESSSLPESPSKQFDETDTEKVKFDNKGRMDVHKGPLSETDVAGNQKMVLHVESNSKNEPASTHHGPNVFNNGMSSKQHITLNKPNSFQSEIFETPSRPMRLANSKKIVNTGSNISATSSQTDTLKNEPATVLSSTPLVRNDVSNIDGQRSFMEIMNSSPISYEKIDALDNSDIDNDPSLPSEHSVNNTTVRNSRTHNNSSEPFSMVYADSITDPFVTARSAPSSTNESINQDDLVWNKETKPPDLPTSPMPVLSQVSSFVPSPSMTYITEIQVVTSDGIKATVSDKSETTLAAISSTESFLNMEKYMATKLSGETPKSAYVSSKPESVETETEPIDTLHQQSKNNVTVTAIKTSILSDTPSTETRQFLQLAPNNSTISVTERKSKLPRPPVPPRKSEIISLISSNNVSQSPVIASNSGEKSFSASQGVNTSNNGRFITFSTLTPRSGLVSEGNVGRNNSSFEQWVFLDEAKNENISNQNGLETSAARIGESRDIKHSSFLTFPSNGGNRSQSVTHISFDLNKGNKDNITE